MNGTEIPKLTSSELKTLELYARTIFGCHWDDLEYKEQLMLIGYVRDKNPTFLRRPGVV